MQDGGKPGVDEEGERRVFDEVSDEVVSDLWTRVYEGRGTTLLLEGRTGVEARGQNSLGVLEAQLGAKVVRVK